MYHSMTLHDSYGILDPMTVDTALRSLVHLSKRYGSSSNLLHATSNQVTMKMLKIYEDGNEHHYTDVIHILFPDRGYGHDIDCWRSLVKRGMISLSSKHSHGKMFYKISDFGREVLSIVEANRLYSRISRWFKVDDDDRCAAMMEADLRGEEAWKDLLPESFIELFEALFNPTSSLRRIGSCYRWMNNTVWLIKSNNEFYQKIDCPEVMTWLQEHKNIYRGIDKFLNIVNKAKKKWAKKAA